MQCASSWSAAFAVALFVSLAASPASAVQISQVSYEVTGGTFDGALSSGAITGGSAVWTVPGGYGVSTPVTTSGGYAGLLQVILTGPSGYFRATWDAFGLRINPTRFGASGASLTVGVRTGTGSDLVSVFVGGFGYESPLSQSGLVRDYTRPYYAVDKFGHSFEIGNEVRTIVPEPSTATLLGLGLIASAAVGSCAARARRGRRR